MHQVLSFPCRFQGHMIAELLRKIGLQQAGLQQSETANFPPLQES